MADKQINWWQIAVIAIVAALLFGLGFFIGRKKDPDVVIKTEIKYVELPPVHDTISNPVPYKVVAPADSANIILSCIKSGRFAELFPKSNPDTVYITKEDTAAVLKDWATERLYCETLFDSDTLGRFKFDAKVQYNKLEKFDYVFTPIQKQTEKTIRVTRKFLPYAGAGVGTNSSVIAQGGMFFHQDAGFAVQYNYNWQLKQHSGSALFLYMF